MAERRVLFVCVENAARSLMAEAIFNANAPQGWVAESAGTKPAAHPNSRTGRMLAELGIDLPPHAPRALTRAASEGASIVVTMGCLDDASCPAHLQRRELRDWGLPDPGRLDDDGFRSVRDEIRRRVDALISKLHATSPVRAP
jgi:arsenate reductase